MNYITTLTDEVEKRIIAQAEIGKSVMVKAKSIGISSTLLKNWLKTGESHYIEVSQGIKNEDQTTPSEIKDKCARLWIKVNKAKAQKEQDLLEVVLKEINGGDEIVKTKEVIRNVPQQQEDGTVTYERMNVETVIETTEARPNGKLALTVLEKLNPEDWLSKDKNQTNVEPTINVNFPDRVSKFVKEAELSDDESAVAPV